MIAYTVATALVFLVCFLAYRSKPEKYADLMGVSALLAIVFVINNLLVTMYGFPEAILAAPVLDCFLAGMIYRAWQKSREGWKVVMVGSLVAQLMLHVVAINMWKLGADATGALSLCCCGQCVFHRSASGPWVCRGRSWSGSASRLFV